MEVIGISFFVLGVFLMIRSFFKKGNAGSTYFVIGLFVTLFAISLPIFLLVYYVILEPLMAVVNNL